VVVDEASPRCGFASDVAALVAQNCFGALKGPVKMVTPPHVPPPFSASLEDMYVPGADRIVATVREAVGGGVSSAA
jgi:pyruvate dehydrogenase E1 component beta subunit